MSRDPSSIRDPKAIRAMAHPLRLRLLEVLAAEGTATATRCAQLLGESPASCSFHLRTLAKYGFIERAPGSGRERPWRLTSVERRIDADVDDADALAASRALDEVFLDWEFARLRDAQQRSPELRWRRATFTAGATLWLTPEEARSVGADLTALVERFVDRTEDPARRPSDSRPVRLFAAISLVPGLSQPVENQSEEQ